MTENIPTALLETVGADFQDGEALWYFPAEQVPGWFDVVIHHEDSGRIVRYTHEDSSDTVTAYEHGKVVEIR
ncbi:hypothetical protein ACI7YT_12485 [Microbacterium sp. M]|uniref:hypothetical protein n=1 Tax=Microbacterium sp. M TaxID=3377125 RepID=UPI003867FAFB